MASQGALQVAQSRKGRRPMRVSTMLRKEKEGTLYKYTKLGEVKEADVIFGDSKKGRLVSGGLFVGGSQKDLQELQQMVLQHGSLQRGREAFQKKYPNKFVTAAFRYAKEPEKPSLGFLRRFTSSGRKERGKYDEAVKEYQELTARSPRIFFHGGPVASPAQTDFYNSVFRAKYDPKYVTKLEKKAYKLQGHTEVQGVPIAIENRKGSVRKGTDKDGHEWRTKMKHPYGYIVGTKGADGEPVDAYVGPDKDADKAYVVHQHKEDGTGYDEDKVMLGFKNKTEARKAYLKHYDSDKFLGPISIVTMERLRELVEAKKKMVKISSFTAELAKIALSDAEKEEKEEREENTEPKPGMKERMREFFLKHPEPEDYEVHALAKKEGINPHHFEEQVYEELGELLKKEKTSSDSMLDELMKLSAISPLQFEAAKLKERAKKPITKSEARASLKRLKQLEKTTATPGQLARAAGVGAIVGPLAQLAYRAAAGPASRGLAAPVAHGVAAGSLKPLGVWRGPRDMAAASAYGAIMSSLLPAGRHKLEREVEKQKLREYVGAHKRGTLRGKIRRTTGL